MVLSLRREILERKRGVGGSNVKGKRIRAEREEEEEGNANLI